MLQSCPTLCNPIDGSPPGSPVPGILQARTLEPLSIEHATSSPPIYFKGIPNIDYLMEFDLKFNPRPEVINLESTNALKSYARCMFCGYVRPHFPWEGDHQFSSASGNGLQPYKLRTTALKQHPKIWPTKRTNDIYDRGFGNCLFFFQEANFTL